jgi:O-antigen/teichoic acid export membrane protein
LGGQSPLAHPKLLSPVTADRFVGHNILVAGGSVAAGLLGFGFQALVSHQLRPSDYGAVFAAMTLLTFVGLPVSALTLLMAREASRDRAAGHSAASAALLRAGNRALLVAGVSLGLLLAAGSPWIGSFFRVPPQFVVAIAASMPAALTLPFLMGELQGQQRFFLFSLVNVAQAVLKVVAAIAFGLALGPVGVVIGLAVAATISYTFVFWLLRHKLAVRASVAWLRPTLRYLALILPSTLALSVLLSADVLLVKHFFGSREAGEYSAVAALGRAIFWGAAGVAAVLFPKVTFHEAQGRNGSQIVGVSLGLVAAGGVAGLAVLSVAARPILTAFAGPAYAVGASILPLYAIAMTLLGAASVLIATHQSRARGLFLAVLLPITVAEPILIALFHNGLRQVVWVVILSMATLVGGLAMVMLRQPAQGVSDRTPAIVAIVEAKG